MNGVHDMGGDQDMGPIQYEKDEPVFHAPWEGRVYAINRALGAGEGGRSTVGVTGSNSFPRPTISA